MDNTTRNKIAKEVFDGCLNILDAKGMAYSGKEDVLNNFKIIAAELGLTKYQVWSVYFNKHILTINNSIKINPECPVDYTEGLSGRIKDAINYLIILEAMLREDIDKQSKYNPKTGVYYPAPADFRNIF